MEEKSTMFANEDEAVLKWDGFSGMPPKSGKQELRYQSPTGKVYSSPKMASKAYIDQAFGQARMGSVEPKQPKKRKPLGLEIRPKSKSVRSEPPKRRKLLKKENRVVFTLTAFEAHARSTNHWPAANIILDDGSGSIPYECLGLMESPMANGLAVLAAVELVASVKPLPVGNNLTWTLLKSDHHAHVHGMKSSAEKENQSRLRAALEVMHECFEPSESVETGRDLVEDVIFNRVSKLKRLDSKGFYTAVLEENDDLVSVATLRVYDNRVAEMPLVATRFRHRRRGMCRALVGLDRKESGEIRGEKLVFAITADHGRDVD
ncbi:PHD finger transcription factor [Hibiscus syriacus]|uniref:PHD finger transcription factor n=1 Tax=Hibiscus syriacus TaxID=106335 RepID=A0A6A3CQ64_HIBSY|nr:PHD finger transcription factor [Hibiscus syriacus]